MQWVPGGTFLMGSDRHYPEEAPTHRVTVHGFWMDTHPVTNAAFAQFVDSTGYVTLAERRPDPADYPGALEEFLVPASTVFLKRPAASTSAIRTTGGPTSRGPSGVTRRARAAA